MNASPLFPVFRVVWCLKFVRCLPPARGILAPDAWQGDPRTLQSHHRPEEPNHGASSSSCRLCTSLRDNGHAAHRLQGEGGRQRAPRSLRGACCTALHRCGCRLRTGGVCSAHGQRGCCSERHGDGTSPRATDRPRHPTAGARASSRATPSAGSSWLRLLGPRLLPLGWSPILLGEVALGAQARTCLRAWSLGAPPARPRLDRRPLGVGASA